MRVGDVGGDGGRCETGRQCLGGRKQELEVGKAIPKKKALWECGRSVEEE